MAAVDNITIKTDKDMTVEVNGKSTETVEKTQEVTVKQSFKLDAATELTLKCGQARSCSSSRASQIKARTSPSKVRSVRRKGTKVDVQGTGPVTVKGATVAINLMTRDHRHRRRLPAPGRPHGRAGARQRLGRHQRGDHADPLDRPGRAPDAPDFGCGIHDYVFESVDAVRVGRLEREIRIALDRWEPRIEVRQITIDTSRPRSGQLPIEHQVRRPRDERPAGTSSTPST